MIIFKIFKKNIVKYHKDKRIKKFNLKDMKYFKLFEK